MLLYIEEKGVLAVRHMVPKNFPSDVEGLYIVKINNF